MIYHGHNNKSLFDSEGRYSLDDLGDCARACVKAIKPHADKFDTIVAQGMSGVIVAVPVALALGKRLTIVRKTGEESHQQQWHEGPAGTVLGLDAIRDGSRALFLDDCIATGETAWRVTQTVAAAGGKVVANFIYERLTWEDKV